MLGGEVKFKLKWIKILRILIDITIEKKHIFRLACWLIGTRFTGNWAARSSSKPVASSQQEYDAGVYSATREHVSVHTRGLVQPGIAIKWVAKIGSRLLSHYPSCSASSTDIFSPSLERARRSTRLSLFRYQMQNTAAILTR